jgi:hypothetical protein
MYQCDSNGGCDGVGDVTATGLVIKACVSIRAHGPRRACRDHGVRLDQGSRTPPRGHGGARASIKPEACPSAGSDAGRDQGRDHDGGAVISVSRPGRWGPHQRGPPSTTTVPPYLRGQA